MPVRRRLLRWMSPLKMPVGPPGREVRVPGTLGQQSRSLPSRSGSPFKIDSEHALRQPGGWNPPFFSDLTVESTEVPMGMLSGWPLWRRHRRDSDSVGARASEGSTT
jgi:hypothetical protein